MKIKILGYSIDMMKVLTPIIYIILGVLFFKIIKGIIKKAKFARNKLKQSQIQRIETIKSTNWSYLDKSQNNRITLITCIENKPDLRLCIQAIQK